MSAARTRRRNPETIEPADLDKLGLPPGEFWYAAREFGGDYGALSRLRERWTWRPEDSPVVLYFAPDYLSGSDYSGGTVEQSNRAVFLEDFGALPGVVDCFGGHGTFAVAIRADLLLDISPERDGESKRTTKRREMLAALQGLSDYPLLDEGAHSILEIEREGEDWESYGAADFADYLSGLSREVLGLSEETIDLLDLRAADTEDSFVLYRELCELSNDYPHSETGGNFYFPFPSWERVSRSVPFEWEGRPDPVALLAGYVRARAAAEGPEALAALAADAANLAADSAAEGRDAARFAQWEAVAGPQPKSGLIAAAAATASHLGAVALALGAPAR